MTVDSTKGEYQATISDLEKHTAELEKMEKQVLRIRDDVSYRAESDSSDPAKQDLKLKSAEAKLNKALTGISDSIGALTATLRALNHGLENAPAGLFDGKKKKPPAQATPAEASPTAKAKPMPKKKAPAAKKTSKKQK